MTTDVWKDAVAYERFIGRWSREVAAQFVRWLPTQPGSTWLDFGCGSGALAQTILRHADPKLVVGCDESAGYVRHASEQTIDDRARFAVASVGDLPAMDGGFDACVSGLVLNFLPEPAAGVAALAARTRPGGTVAAYVWDYADGMQLLRVFWDAAVDLDPAARPLDEGVRFPVCQPEALRRLFQDAGLRDLEWRPIDVPTTFTSIDDYWRPFLGGQGPAPGYVAGLSAEHRERLRLAIQDRVPADGGGPIHMTARAWAIRGVVSRQVSVT